MKAWLNAHSRVLAISVLGKLNLFLLYHKNECFSFIKEVAQPGNILASHHFLLAWIQWCYSTRVMALTNRMALDTMEDKKKYFLPVCHPLVSSTLASHVLCESKIWVRVGVSELLWSRWRKERKSHSSSLNTLYFQDIWHIQIWIAISIFLVLFSFIAFSSCHSFQELKVAYLIIFSVFYSHNHPVR